MSVDSIYFSPKGVTKEDVFEYFKNKYGEAKITDDGNDNGLHFYSITVDDKKHEAEYGVGINGFRLLLYTEPDEEVNNNPEEYGYPTLILSGALKLSCEANDITIDIMQELASTLKGYFIRYDGIDEWEEYN